MAKRPGSSNTIRIIGGIHKGRKLQFPDAKGLRPTADRVRETLFNWLQNVVPGGACLDLFAGSGALGFEAVSRGAEKVVAIESSVKVLKQLKHNAQMLGVEQRVQLVQADAISWLTRQETDRERFDVVFIDPPFAQQKLAEIIRLLDESSLLKMPAYIYIERDCHSALPDLPKSWKLLKEKQAGQVCFGLFLFQSE